MNNKAPIGEFSGKMTSATVRPGTAGNMIVEANIEGTATGYGAFCGTMTATPAGHQSGTYQWHAVAFPDDGSTVSATGQGVFTTIGKTRWRMQGTMQDSNGNSVTGDGELDLASRVWSGKIFAAK